MTPNAGHTLSKEGQWPRNPGLKIRLDPFFFFTNWRHSCVELIRTAPTENAYIVRKKLEISDFVIVLSDKLKLYFRTSIRQTKTFHGFRDVMVTKLCELTAFIVVNELIFYNVFGTDAGE